MSGELNGMVDEIILAKVISGQFEYQLQIVRASFSFAVT